MKIKLPYPHRVAESTDAMAMMPVGARLIITKMDQNSIWLDTVPNGKLLDVSVIDGLTIACYERTP